MIFFILNHSFVFNYSAVCRRMLLVAYCNISIFILVVDLIWCGVTNYRCRPLQSCWLWRLWSAS